jgi:FtsH-binding integral membrane protein
MERQGMWVFAMLFFGSLPIWAILLVVSIFSPSTSSGKAAGVLTVLMFTGLLGMVGLNILSRFTVLKKMDEGSAPRESYVP